MINSVEELAAIRQAKLDGADLSLDQLREVADFIRMQRGVRGPKKGKEKAKTEILDIEGLFKIFGL